MPRLVVTATTVAVIVCLLVHDSGSGGTEAGPPNLETLVFLAESLGGDQRPAGCRAISVLDLHSMSVVFRGSPSQGSLGRLAASDDFSVVLAGVGDAGGSSPFTMARWAGDGWDTASFFNRGRASIGYSGIALMGDGNSWLYSHGRRAGAPGALLAKHRLSDISDGLMPPTKEPTDTLQLDDHAAAELLRLGDTPAIAAVTELGNIHVVDVPTLSSDGPATALEPIGHAGEFTYGERVRRTYADVSLEDRYVVTNRWDAPGLNVGDLVERRAWTLSVGTGITMTGGIAFNRGYINTGLLAVHAVSQVLVYRFDPFGELVELSRVPLAPAYSNSPPYGAEPGAVSWSATGSHIVAVSETGTSEFAVIEVEKCGRQLRKVAEVAACEDVPNVGTDVLSANGRITPPTDYVSPCPTPILNPPSSVGPSRSKSFLPTVAR